MDPYSLTHCIKKWNSLGEKNRERRKRLQVGWWESLRTKMTEKGHLSGLAMSSTVDSVSLNLMGHIVQSADTEI